MDNRQAIGYMLLACKELGYTQKQAQALCWAMNWEFDSKTEEEAEERGFSWYHSLEEE